MIVHDWTLSWAAAERLEQVFIQARSLATWSTELGVYLVISGVEEALTGALEPQPADIAGAPMSGLMLA